MKTIIRQPSFILGNRFLVEQTGSRATRSFRSPRDLVSRRKLEYLVRAQSQAGSYFDDTLLPLALRYLTAREKSKIIRDLIRIGKRQKIEMIDFIESCQKDGSETFSDAMEAINDIRRFRGILCKRLMVILSGLLGHLPPKTGQSLLEKKLDEACNAFGLNPADREILLLLHLVATDYAVDRIFNTTVGITDMKTGGSAVAKIKKPIEILTGLSRSLIEMAFAEKAAIMRVGLLTSDGEIVPEIIDFLEGSTSKPFSRRYFCDFSGKAVALDCHTVDGKHVKTLTTLFRHKLRGRGINILLYGEPGTGKTEFARSLGGHVNAAIYEVASSLEEKNNSGDPKLFRYRAFIACQRMVDTEHALIIVDEADALLNAGTDFFSRHPGTEKGQINRLLDDSAAFTIWITNRYDEIDDSTKRRFDYSIGFKKMTHVQRCAVWRHSLIKHGLTGCLDENDVESLASEYEINAGGIDIALRNASCVFAKNGSKREMMEVVRNLVKAHLCILDTGKNSSEEKKSNAPSYTLDGLNIKDDMVRTLKVIDRFNACWQNPDDETAVRNMNLLLYGPPGTGKTEFARYIARRTNRILILKRASDLLSCWVGESEKNIKRAFEEAEGEKAILFIDEADSLFWNRDGATHSWEVTQVNELLTRMESFRGMLICSTNFKQIVDSAAIRRFNIKLEFDFLKPEGNEVFYRLFLETIAGPRLTAPDIMRLKSMSKLTPGDFKVVQQKFSFFSREELTHAMLLEALDQELSAKDSRHGKTIGFSK